MPGGEWQAHIEGACGRSKVAKAAGKYWGGSINTFKDGGNTSTGWEVMTRSSHDHDNCQRQRPGWAGLHIGDRPVTDVSHSWLDQVGGREAEEWRRRLWLAYFVPQKLLKSETCLSIKLSHGRSSNAWTTRPPSWC